MLYETYGFLLHRRCRVLLKDAALADDALQEAFVKIMRAGGRVREMNEPLPWLYLVTSRVCFDQLKKRKGNLERSDEFIDEVGVAPGVDHEMRSVIFRILEELDDDSKAIALFAFVDGMTQEEIAGELGLSRVTINKRVQAIRERALEIAGVSMNAGEEKDTSKEMS